MTFPGRTWSRQLSAACGSASPSCPATPQSARYWNRSGSEPKYATCPSRNPTSKMWCGSSISGRSRHGSAETQSTLINHAPIIAHPRNTRTPSCARKTGRGERNGSYVYARDRDGCSLTAGLSPVGVGGRVVPAQHPQRPQGVPPARRAVGFLKPEVDLAGVVVLEQPTPVGSALCADAFDRFGQPRIRSAPTPGEVLRGLEQVVVPAWGVGEQRPLRVDHLARA